MKQIIGFGAAIALILGLVFYFAPNKQEDLGALYLKTTVTSQSLDVLTATTSLWANNSGLSKVRIVNRGVTNAYCAFGVNVNATKASGGLLITSNASNTTGSVWETTDQNYLSKPANCLADGASTTLAITKY